jgi:hypothetical protein
MAQTYADLVEFRALRALSEGTFYPPPPHLRVDGRSIPSSLSLPHHEPPCCQDALFNCPDCESAWWAT